MKTMNTIAQSIINAIPEGHEVTLSEKTIGLGREFGKGAENGEKNCLAFAQSLYADGVRAGMVDKGNIYYSAIRDAIQSGYTKAMQAHLAPIGERKLSDAEKKLRKSAQDLLAQNYKRVVAHLGKMEPKAEAEAEAKTEAEAEAKAEAKANSDVVKVVERLTALIKIVEKAEAPKFDAVEIAKDLKSALAKALKSAK